MWAGPYGTCTTRWGNQYRQVARNNTLKPVIDPVVETYKRENRTKKDAIVEDDGDVRTPMPAILAGPRGASRGTAP